MGGLWRCFTHIYIDVGKPMVSLGYLQENGLLYTRYIDGYLRTQVHRYVVTQIHRYIDTQIHTCILTHILTHIHTYLHTHLHASCYIYIYICIFVFVLKEQTGIVGVKCQGIAEMGRFSCVKNTLAYTEGLWLGSLLKNASVSDGNLDQYV